ncbi:MAG: hypothetical protein J6W07_06280 [Bacteroidales bacterium]|nr:hypothetical protein [Bacteroidales bacterium]MBP5796422.1 hypothetical protein [Bacteroidales bacterium]
MKKIGLLILAVAGIAVCACSPKVQKVDKYAIDCTQIRGFNYTPATVADPRHHVDTWVSYDPDEAAFNLDLAKSLNLNMARVFVPYQCFTELGDELAPRLQDFARKLDERGMGFVPVVGSGRWMRDTSLLYQAEEWVDYLVNALKDEPNLMMWDLMNEPDLAMFMKDINFENCKLLYKLFKEKDPDTPLTIGMEKVSCMIEMADYADILQFHNYSETRDMVRDTIALAKAFAASVGKQVFNGEMGCIARGNPYDVTLEEHMKAGMGWTIWELMIVRQGWGTVHGVFYEDGTVRDPSIPAAIMGWFRNRENPMDYFPDREDKITSVLNRIDQWKKDGAKDLETGLHIAEVGANMLESAQLAPMAENPNWEVNQLRKSKDLKELKTLLDKYYTMLKPYKK